MHPLKILGRKLRFALTGYRKISRFENLKHGPFLAVYVHEPNLADSIITTLQELYDGAERVPRPNQAPASQLPPDIDLFLCLGQCPEALASFHKRARHSILLWPDPPVKKPEPWHHVVTEGQPSEALSASYWRELLRPYLPKILSIGAGEDARPGLINYDLRELDGIQVVGCARHLPFASDSFDRVIAHDILEHFSLTELEPTLKEWLRVLKIGGELRLRVPDMKALAKQWLDGRLSFEEYRCWIYGDQKYQGGAHLTGFEETQLRALLSRCGLTDIERLTERVSSKNIQMRATRRS